jgi:hypothetical protein
MHRVGALFLGIVLMSATAVRSEPIAITDGLIRGFPGHGLSLSLRGDGFTYAGGGGDWGPMGMGLCDPFPCHAGTAQSFHHAITAVDQFVFGGTGQYQGAAFSVPWPASGAALQLVFSGTYTVPELPASTWTITTPFTFNGFVDPLELDQINLVGGGTLTLTASNMGFPSGSDIYFASRIQYDFDFQPAPVPEPSSVVLVAAGVGILGVLRRRIFWARTRAGTAP